MIGPSPIAAIVPTGRLSISEPSISSRRPSTWGGPRTGSAMLVPTAGTSGPCRWTTISELRRSALTHQNDRSSSSIDAAPNVRSSEARKRVPRISP
jgi:hypothetical protein